MSQFIAHITIMPLTELLDPQGKAVLDTLNKLGHVAINNVRIGKNINLTIDAATSQDAYDIAENACKKILYNAVMEQYHINIEAIAN
jgi:phosphoribosylformylglycinamidine synthase subunit PurS